MTDPPDAGGAAAPREGGDGHDPGVPLFLKLLWAAFAVWAAVYTVRYLVPEFREWWGSR